MSSIFLRSILAVLLVWSSTGLAQDVKQQYARARQNYQDRKFDQALDGFKPLMVYDAGNPYAEYASFFYALSAYRLNYKSLAKSTLIGMLDIYPDWNRQDDVRYWLATIYFEQGEWFQAMKLLSQLKSDPDLYNMKSHFLAGIKDPEILRMLLEDFHDKAAAGRLIRLLLSLRKEETIGEAQRLISTYGFDSNEFEIPEQLSSTDGTAIRVSVLFPFLTQTLEPTPATKKNQYALDLYQGMRLARDSLLQAGINVELNTYDTERNPEKLRSILTRPEIAQSDVLVGPLFTDEFQPVRDYSAATGIPMMHPVSNSPDYTTGNSSAVLFQPSWQTIGAKSAEYIHSLGIAKPCIVFYDKTPRDSILAHAFKKRAEELNIRIVLFREVPKENSSIINSILVTPVKFDKWRNPVEFKLKKDSIGSIFVAADSELIFTKVISSVDSRNDQTVIVGQESWLDKPGMDFMKFEQLHLALASPNFSPVGSLAYLDFQKKYVSAHHVAPSLYAKIGYEFMLFLGDRLSRNGGNDKLLSIMRSGKNPGRLSQGFDFPGTRDNQVVPIISFSNGELVRIR
ncbi:MAG: hypothetical protein ACKO3B_11215 [Bacteroidota bacterium]